MSRSDAALETPFDATAISRGGRVVPDYPNGAIACWLVVTLGGALALGFAVARTSSLALPEFGRTVAMALIAIIVGMFPLRIATAKRAIAAGGIFVFLLLLLNGAVAATVAAAAESAVGAWRTSTRWTVRIAAPAAAALAMLGCGTAYEAGLAALGRAGVTGDGIVVGALMVFAAAYLVLRPTLAMAVHLARPRGPRWDTWRARIRETGLGHVLSASAAGVLYLAFRQFGLQAVAVAIPIITMLLATLHYYFARREAVQREAAERSSRERAEAAEREDAQLAEHLRALERSDRRFHSAFTYAAIGMALVSKEGRVVQANRALCTLLGRDGDAIVGADFRGLLEPCDADAFDRRLRRLGRGESSHFELELRCRHGDGREVWMSMHGSAFAERSAADSHLILQAFDITARRHAEGRLQHLACHDGLTNLANRAGLLEALNAAIMAGARDPLRQFSVMHLNFDCFKRLNESLGHEAGDEFLIKVAQRLRENMRPDDVLARLSGDEFALLTFHHGRGAHHAIGRAERLQEAFRAPIVVNDTEISTGISIGITFSDIEYRSADDALRDAALAMSKARASGKARYAVFDASLHERATERLHLEAELRRALDANELTLAFQPVYELATRRPVGFEALTRWEHPVRGPIPPSDFIPIAEDAGLIGELTMRAIERACMQLSIWRDRFPRHRELVLNVNICGHDLGEPDFAEQVRETLRRYGVPASGLTLEITESTLMQQIERGSSTLERLRELGVQLSVDDFGTGHSSLSHLSRLPISSLKIDRSFVQRMEGGADDLEIVRAVIKLGQALAISVVAEGIETESQLQQLLRFGCSYGQGYLLGAPLMPRQVEALLGEPAGRRTRPRAAGHGGATPFELPRLRQSPGNYAVSGSSGASNHALCHVPLRVPNGKA